MESEQTLLSRLRRLEAAIDHLQLSSLPSTTDQQPLRSSSFPLWVADEFLLTRLLRRSPDALHAYKRPAELLVTQGQPVRLTISEQYTSYFFCQMVEGDAVVWLDCASSDWVRNSEGFHALFTLPPVVVTPSNLVLQSLPLFKPIQSGVSWVLYRRGEMVEKLRPFPEQADRARLIRRIETMERQFVEQRIQFEARISDLEAQIQVQHQTLRTLLRIDGTLASDDPNQISSD